MAIEKMYSIREAARLIGISHNTLRRWLDISGYRMPDVSRGGKVLLSERDVEAIVKKHSAQLDWQLLRRGRIKCSA